MNAEVYADFLQRIGHKVIRTPSAYWFNAYPGTLLAFPYHQPISPSTDELRGLSRRALLARFVSECAGVESYYTACDQKPYTLASLTSKARNQTRRGLEEWRVQARDCAWLAGHGVALNRETLARQGRRETDFTESRWRSFCMAASALPGFEAWAAESSGKVGAVALTFQMGDVGCILLQRSAHSTLGAYPNNALTFVVTEELLRRPDVRMVFYGLRPLAAPAGLDHFKTGMGYRAFPVRERFWVAPLLRPIIPIARLLAEGYSKCAPGSEGARKCARAFDYVGGGTPSRGVAHGL